MALYEWADELMWPFRTDYESKRTVMGFASPVLSRDEDGIPKKAQSKLMLADNPIAVEVEVWPKCHGQPRCLAWLSIPYP